MTTFTHFGSLVLVQPWSQIFPMLLVLMWALRHSLAMNLTAIYEASVFADMVEVMRYLISYSAWKAFCQRSRALPHLLSYSLHHTNMKRTPLARQSTLWKEHQRPRDYKQCPHILALTPALSSTLVCPSGKRMNYNHFQWKRESRSEMIFVL